MAERVELKRCSGCGEAQPLEAFSRNPRTRDGRKGRCKDCCRSYDREWKDANRGRVQEARRRYIEADANRRREQKSRWQKANREKARAHLAVQRAVERGTLHRPTHCEECGSSGLIIGHHADYSKPLEVEWLCEACHGLRHRSASHA